MFNFFRLSPLEFSPCFGSQQQRIMTHRWLGTPLCNNSLLDHTDVLRFVFNLLTLALFVPLFTDETTPTAEILELSSGHNYPAHLTCIWSALVQITCVICTHVLAHIKVFFSHTATYKSTFGRDNFDCGLERETAQKRGLLSEKFAHR